MLLKPRIKILTAYIGDPAFEKEVETATEALKTMEEVVPESLRLTWLADDGKIIAVLEWCEREDH